MWKSSVERKACLTRVQRAALRGPTHATIMSPVPNPQSRLPTNALRHPRNRAHQSNHASANTDA